MICGRIGRPRFFREFRRLVIPKKLKTAEKKIKFLQSGLVGNSLKIMTEEAPAASDAAEGGAAAAGAAAAAAGGGDVQPGEGGAATEGGAASDADGAAAAGATSAEAVKDKVATEEAAAQERGFGEAEEAELKGLSHKERLRLLVPVRDPSGESIPFAYESSKLLLYGKEVRWCCCVFRGWWRY